MKNNKNTHDNMEIKEKIKDRRENHTWEVLMEKQS
jgi:hypothetical protein